MGAVNWASGFLPTQFQGVPLRSGAEPISNLATPKGMSAASQRRALDAIRDLNLARLVETGDPEIATRIASYEMAYRMQTSAPELIDLSSETEATLDLYGAKSDEHSFARNCLLGAAARRARRPLRAALSYQLGHTRRPWPNTRG